MKCKFSDIPNMRLICSRKKRQAYSDFGAVKKETDFKYVRYPEKNLKVTRRAFSFSLLKPGNFLERYT